MHDSMKATDYSYTSVIITESPDSSFIVIHQKTDNNEHSDAQNTHIVDLISYDISHTHFHYTLEHMAFTPFKKYLIGVRRTSSFSPPHDHELTCETRGNLESISTQSFFNCLYSYITSEQPV
jgi:hypothetical protein